MYVYLRISIHIYVCVRAHTCTCASIHTHTYIILHSIMIYTLNFTFVGRIINIIECLSKYNCSFVNHLTYIALYIHILSFDSMVSTTTEWTNTPSFLHPFSRFSPSQGSKNKDKQQRAIYISLNIWMKFEDM